MENYTLVDKFLNNRGEDTTEFKECDGRLIIKQYSGINTDNFVIKTLDGKKLNFTFFKINGIYYVNINGEHIIDYRRFTNIEQISKVDNEESGDESNPKLCSTKIKNGYIGDIILRNCDPEMFTKSLQLMAKHMKNKSSYYSDFKYFMFH